MTIFDNVCYQDSEVLSANLPDVINSFLVSVSDSVPTIRHDLLSSIRSELHVCPTEFIVSEFEVYMTLVKLKVNKASLNDYISNKLLKSLADVLAAPICALVNTSIRQGTVPTQWKMSRISPIPKCLPVRNVETDIRPIAVTCPISKVAEFFISKYFNNHFDSYLDEYQFGSTEGRSTTTALIMLFHILFQAYDDTSNFIRLLFVDFSKAFELIDHSVLHNKLNDCQFPPHLSAWTLSFLDSRTQFVRVGHCVSSVLSTNAGAPQGTRAGPNDFKLVVNDLKFNIPYVKYVDDITIASVSNDSDDNELQHAAEQLADWCSCNGMRLNTRKTKEMLLHFGKKSDLRAIRPISIDGTSIERVSTFKLLGIYINCDLSWSSHIDYVVAKASKRIFVITQLIRAGVDKSDIVNVYSAIIRSVVEYACPVWHCGITKKQSNDVESVQRRCLKILYPELSYADALFVSGLERLDVRRANMVRMLFEQVKKPNHVLHNLLPIKVVDPLLPVTRDVYHYRLPTFKTARPLRSFINYCINKRM